MEIGYSSKNLTPFSAGQNLEILIKRFSVMNDPKFLSRNQNFYCQNSINLSRLYEKLASSASNFSWLNLCNFGVDKMVLAFNWQFYYNDINILESYRRLTLHLVTLYPIFLPSVLDKLCEWLVNKNFFFEEVASEKEIKVEEIHSKIHLFIKDICFLIPMASGNVFSAFLKTSQYRQNDFSVTFSFVKNILRLVDYLPEMIEKIISVVTQKIVELDMKCLTTKKDEKTAIFQKYIRLNLTNYETEIAKFIKNHLLLDKEEKSNDRSLRFVDNLQNLDKLCHFLIDCFAEKSKKLDFLDKIFISTVLSFEKHILPQEVNFLNFSQFVVFIVTNFHTDYPEKFIRLLIDRIVDKNKTTTTRKNSALYLASYIVRAKFLKPTIIFKSLNVLVELALFYSENTKFCNLPIFYSICESIFHIFIYRHNLLSESGEIEKMSKDLLKIISNEPKILRHCSRNIVIAFSVFSTATNLFDCFSVLLCQFRYFCRNKSNSFRFSDQLKKAGLNQENGPRDFICQNETYFPFDLNKQTFEAKDLKFLFKFEEFYSDDKNLQSDLICVLDQQMNENEGSDDENEAMEESDVMEIHFD